MKKCILVGLLFVLGISPLHASESTCSPTWIDVVSRVDAELGELLKKVQIKSGLKTENKQTAFCPGYYTTENGQSCPYGIKIFNTTVFNVRWASPLINATPDADKEYELEQELTAFLPEWEGQSISLSSTKMHLKSVLNGRCNLLNDLDLNANESIIEKSITIYDRK